MTNNNHITSAITSASKLTGPSGLRPAAGVEGVMAPIGVLVFLSARLINGLPVSGLSYRSSWQSASSVVTLSSSLLAFSSAHASSITTVTRHLVAIRGLGSWGKYKAVVVGQF